MFLWNNSIFICLLINKIKNFKSEDNKYMFLSDFQFKKAIITENNMEILSRPFIFLFENFFLYFFFFIIVFVLPYYYFFSNHFSNNLVHLNYSFVIFFFVYMFHEIGHASACLKYNVKASEIGFGITSFFPVMYANVSDSWRLQRNQRILVNISGIYFQNIISFLLLITSILLNNFQFYFIAKTVFIGSLFQFFPFHKSDGYWILSDVLSEPNLFKNTRKLFYKKLRNPTLKIKKEKFWALSYYIIISSVIFYFIIKTGIRFYPYIIKLPLYIKDVLIAIFNSGFKNINFDLQYFWASLFLFFTGRMLYNNIKEFISSKGADDITN